MELRLDDPEFVNSILYPSWCYCFNAECPRTAECICYISSRFLPEGKEWGNAIFPTALRDGKCSHFKRARIMMAAWGMKGLYDNVKHKDAANLRCRVMGILGGKTNYYRVYRGEMHVSPEKQQEVNRVFAEYGYQPPRFDHYKEEVGFTDK